MKFQQNRDEFDWFIDILKRENVRSYLEIGSDEGGSLLAVATALPPSALFMAVDNAVLNPGKLYEAAPKIAAMGHRIKLILGDSTDQRVIQSVRKSGPFDACFIDANHTLSYVTKDWLNYGSMSRIVAFHDIGWKPKEGGPQIDVPEFWNAIKGNYRHSEINLCERNNGIGVLWM